MNDYLGSLDVLKTVGCAGDYAYGMHLMNSISCGIKTMISSRFVIESYVYHRKNNIIVVLH